MLKRIYVMQTMLTAAFDADGQVPEAQGDLVDFYYQLLKERGLADETTQFRYGTDQGPQVVTGAEFDRKWRPQEDGT